MAVIERQVNPASTLQSVIFPIVSNSRPCYSSSMTNIPTSPSNPHSQPFSHSVDANLPATKYHALTRAREKNKNNSQNGPIHA